MPNTYSQTHAPAGLSDREVNLELVKRPFLSDILPKLSTDDQRELSRGLALLLAEAAPLHGNAEEFSRFERLVPPGFDRYFYYGVGCTAMSPHTKELSKAIAEVEFLRHRSAEAHHLALAGIYRSWPVIHFLDVSPKALATAPDAVDPESSPHYWAALGHWASHSWYDTEMSLSLLDAHLRAFLPQFSPSVQRYVLQGTGIALFHHYWMTPFPLVELERFSHAYQDSPLEGWGMALRQLDHFSPFPWQGSESLYWMATTKGFSPRTLVSIQNGGAQFDAFFEGPASSTLKPPRHAP